MPKKDYKTIQLDAKYIPKKSEEYMCPEQKAYFYNMLMIQRAELVAAMEDVANVINVGQKLNSAGAMDEADTSNFQQEADRQLRMHERDANLLRKIDHALAQLENGNFGFSVISGDEIGIKRMMARPLATMTLEEQEEIEKRE
ncbi:MAG: RNA polymerase-binding protein DksA [Alphaproteobacteria bacterium]|nr:RNA polymerase-binding protein DksA [Alphaproteobacteria bacterium]MCL2889948.1 RNA polymerase-binding protein DksA [Alphaproteobacteria bacterium]